MSIHLALKIKTINSKNMKKYLFVSILMMLAHVQTLKAEATDVSTMDNLIYAMPFTAARGELVELPFAMKNSVPIRSFQFKLYVPEGMTPAKSSSGKIKATLNASRLPEDDQHTMTFSEHQDEGGYYILVLCGAEYDENFSVGDGLAFTIQFDIAGDMELGDHPVVLREMTLSETNTTKYYESDNIEGTLTIEENDGRVVLDENSTSMPEPATGVNVRVKRTINKGNWSTICLPFAMTAEQCTQAFGQDVKIADFTGTESEFDEEDNVIGIKAGFGSVTSMEENHPYIIKVKENIAEFTVDGVDIEPDEGACIEFDNGKTGSRRVVYSGFYGTYVANTVLDKFTLFLSGNKFCYSAGKTKMKAFRAYFDFLDILTDVEENAGAKIAFMVDDTPTRIEGLAAGKAYPGGAVYTIGGQLVGKDVDMKQMKKGVYVRDGRKVVVK